MATREGRRRDPCEEPFDGRLLRGPLSTFCDNVQIFGKDTEEEPPTFIIRTLLMRGAIAFDRKSNRWFAFTATGPRRRDGFPSQVRLHYGFGKTSNDIQVFMDRDDDVCIIPANAFMDPPSREILSRMQTLDMISTAMAQNIDALKQCAGILYHDQTLTNQLDRAEKARLQGRSTVHLQTKIGDDVKLVNFGPEARSFIPDFLAVWTNTVEELDEATGRVKIGEKTERRTDDEISVIENSACSAIDTVINTFNRYCKFYGVRARAERGAELVHRRIEENAPESPKEAEEGNESDQLG